MRIDRPDQLDVLDFGKGGGLVPVVAQHARTGAVLMLAYANREALRRTLETGLAWYWSRSRGRLWCKGEMSGHTQRIISLHVDCDADAVLAQVEPAGPACHTGAPTCFAADQVQPAHAADTTERSTGGSHRGVARYPIALAARPAESEADRAAKPSKRSPRAPTIAGASNTPEPTGDVYASAHAGPLPTLAMLAAVLDARVADAPEGSYTGKLLADRNLRLKKLGEEAIELALACAAEDVEATAAEAADLLYHTLVACLGAGVRLDDVLAVLDQRAGRARVSSSADEASPGPSTRFT